MLTNLLFFLLAGATLSLLLWTGLELFQTAGGSAGRPAGGAAIAGAGRGAADGAAQDRRQRARPRFSRSSAVFPGGEDWMRGSERLLHRAGHAQQVRAGGVHARHDSVHAAAARRTGLAEARRARQLAAGRRGGGADPRLPAAEDGAAAAGEALSPQVAGGAAGHGRPARHRARHGARRSTRR